VGQKPNEEKHHDGDAVDNHLAQADHAPELEDIDRTSAYQQEPRKSGEEPIDHVPSRAACREWTKVTPILSSSSQWVSSLADLTTVWRHMTIEPIRDFLSSSAMMARRPPDTAIGVVVAAFSARSCRNHCSRSDANWGSAELR
jgi:hypothetical protein